MEGIRGSGIEGDIAIDDVTIEEGECRDPPPSSSEYIGCLQFLCTTSCFGNNASRVYYVEKDQPNCYLFLDMIKETNWNKLIIIYKNN